MVGAFLLLLVQLMSSGELLGLYQVEYEPNWREKAPGYPEIFDVNHRPPLWEAIYYWAARVGSAMGWLLSATGVLMMGRSLKENLQWGRSVS